MGFVSSRSREPQAATIFLALVRSLLGHDFPGFSLAAVGRLNKNSGVRGRGVGHEGRVRDSVRGGGADMKDLRGESGREIAVRIFVGEDRARDRGDNQGSRER